MEKEERKDPRDEKSKPSKDAGKGRKEDLLRIKETEELLKSLVDKEREILQTEDALVEAMKRFRDLFEQSPIGVGIHDTQGELLIINKAYLELFGIDSFSKITHQNLFSGLKLTEENAFKLRDKEVVQYEAEYNFDKSDLETNRDGMGYILFTVSPIFRDNDIIGYMVQGQDITERRKVEESQKLAQLGRLLSDMAHEVNNPLMIISGRAELALLEGVRDEKLKDTLNIILDQCFFAKDIIQRLLKYSRLGKVEKKPVDIPKAMEFILDILEHHFKMANVTVKNNIPDEHFPPVMGNEKSLQEVFMNVLRNAAEAMPAGGVITVSISRARGYLSIDIEDTGEGMPKEVMDRIFEPFFTTKQKGTGLGLAVCHTIVQEEHGGELLYESRIGEGTTATVLLPMMHEPENGG